MTNEEALAALEKKISCYNAAISDCLFNCDICDRSVETDKLMSAIEVAAGVMRGVVDHVRHGRWVRGYPITCSECGLPAVEICDNSEKYEAWLTEWCHHCGAKMDAGEEKK